MDVAARIERLEAALCRLDDKDEIRRLMGRYARAVDEDLAREQEAIFTDDAYMETRPWFTGRGHYGRAAVVGAFRHYIATFTNRRRFITNDRVDLTGRDTATGWANWLVLHAHQAESYCGWGTYDWVFARTPDGWQISSMIINVDCMTTLKDGWADANRMVARFPGASDR